MLYASVPAYETFKFWNTHQKYFDKIFDIGFFGWKLDYFAESSEGI